MYILPNIGIQIKIWDYDFACIAGIVENTKVNAEWTDRINVNSNKNRYYDIHYFLNTFTKKGFFPEFWEVPEISKQIKDFVNRVVPDEYKEGDKIAERGRLLVNEEFTTPDEILKTDVFFNKLRPKEDRI